MHCKGGRAVHVVPIAVEIAADDRLIARQQFLNLRTLTFNAQISHLQSHRYHSIIILSVLLPKCSAPLKCLSYDFQIEKFHTSHSPNQFPFQGYASRLAKGGMDKVWVAEQHQPVRRRLALTLVKSGMDTRQVLARFEAERQALSMMDHPNIAKGLDAGTIEAGGRRKRMDGFL